MPLLREDAMTRSGTLDAAEPTDLDTARRRLATPERLREFFRPRSVERP
jgi:hypothetical protein